MKKFAIKITSMIIYVILFMLKIMLSRIPVLGGFSDKIIDYIKERIEKTSKAVLALVVGVFVLIPIILTIGGVVFTEIYKTLDDDPDRGAVAIKDGAYGESYSTPVYLDQGWSESGSLWFYNTTQGSGLLPYDFFLVLEKANSKELFRSNKNIDRFRYLPQKMTFFNPDALPVGIVKDTYQGKDYVGFTCAACHTGQINYKGRAIRIDGGPAMADMVTFLKELQKAMEDAQKGEKNKKFVEKVIALNNDYSTAQEVNVDLKKWTNAIRLYNFVNHSTHFSRNARGWRRVVYGYARLDAFGRIYNRVLQHVISRDQLADVLAQLRSAIGRYQGRYLLNQTQIKNVLAGVDEVVIQDDDFALILKRLTRPEPEYPRLSRTDMLRLRDKMFNSPNAPVSYPFLWDITRSDYVQWNGLASNGGSGPLERNAGKAIGFFAILDWRADDRLFGLPTWLRRFNLSSIVSGQSTTRTSIYFKSSINLTNLKRLESHLHSLKSPEWPESILGKIDKEKARRGKLHYARQCLYCHDVIDRNDWERRIVSKMFKLKAGNTDPAMARNSVSYRGKSGYFKNTYQEVEIGTLLLVEDAPVVQILTAAAKSVVGAADPDKWFVRRWIDWAYAYGTAYTENPIKKSVKLGNYNTDTVSKPYYSLFAYRARSLNGIWATAPYLHNGSVPNLYDLLLPAKREGDVDGDRCEKYRPDSFMVGAREFDPVKVGFKSEGYKGFEFKTNLRGNRNTGHEYGACRMKDRERWDLIEYLKTL